MNPPPLPPMAPPPPMEMMPMHWHSPFFVLTLVAMFVLARVAMTAIRARHGLPAGGSRHRHRHDADTIGADRALTLLAQENERLTGKVSRLEERIAVLERIATDPAIRTAREIEALRDR